MVLVAGFGLSTVSWLIFAVTFAFDLSRYSLERTWLWRFPLVLIAAGQVAQLRYCSLLLINLLYQKPNADREIEGLHLYLLYPTLNPDRKREGLHPVSADVIASQTHGHTLSPSA